MPKPLSKFFTDVFAKDSYKNLLVTFNQKPFNWNCVKIFEDAPNYSSAIEDFRLFYSEKLLSTNLADLSCNFYEALEQAKDAYTQEQTLPLKQEADKRAGFWIEDTFQKAQTPPPNSDTLAKNDLVPPINSVDSLSHADQTTASHPQPSFEAQPMSREEQTKRELEEQTKREIVASYLQEAEEIISQETTRKSRDDIDKLFSLLKNKYYPIETDKSARKSFRADLIKRAATGLSTPLQKQIITLSQYLASAQLKTTDEFPYRLMHYRFFLAVIKEYAGENALALVDAGNFAELEQLINHIQGFAQKCSQSQNELIKDLAKKFQAEKASVASIICLNGKKSEKGQTEFIRKLTTQVAIQNLPSFALLIKLHPGVEQLFAAPELADTMKAIAHLATSDKNDIHNPLLQLLKICLPKKETELVKKILLIFMALKKPSDAMYKHLVSLLPTCPEYTHIVKDFSQITLNSFSDYHTLLDEAAKTNDVDDALIGKLFDIAIAKAKDLPELLRLASVCKNNAALVERLARSLYARFPTLDALKSLMERVNCTEIVEKLVDEEIKKQIANFEKTLDIPGQVLSEAQKCEKLLSFIEKEIAPQIEQSPKLNALLNPQRKKLSDVWFAQLASCRDQFILPKEILEQRQILNGEAEIGDGQEFALALDEGLKSIRNSQTPLLAQLEQANTLYQKLLEALETNKARVSDEYAELVQSYPKEISALLQNQQALTEDLRKKSIDLGELRTKIINEKERILPNDFAEPEHVKAYFSEVEAQFIKMQTVTDDLFTQFEEQKTQQLEHVRELEAFSKDNQQLSAETMGKFCDFRKVFATDKQATHQLAANIFTEVDKARQGLFTQAGLLKEMLDEKLNKLKSEIDASEKALLETKANIEACDKTIQAAEKTSIENTAQIKLNQQAIDENQTKIQATTNDRTGLTGKYNPLNQKIASAYKSEKLEKSIDQCISVLQRAIEAREAQKESFFSRFKVWVAVIVLTYRERMPESWVTWASLAKTDINTTLPEEIDAQKRHLVTLRNFKSSLEIQTAEKIQEFNTINQNREALKNLATNLSLKDDSRVFIFWRWWANHVLDKFSNEIASLEKHLSQATHLQATEALLIKNEGQLQINIKALAEDSLARKKATEDADALGKAASENKPSLEKSKALLEARLAELNQQKERERPLYSDLILKLSSPLIDILYNAKFNDDQKFLLFQKKLSSEGQTVLSQEGLGDGVCANLLYHVVRHGTVAMLEYILSNLSEDYRSRYLATAIVEDNVVTTPLARAVKLGQVNKIACLVNYTDDVNETIMVDDKQINLLLWAYQQKHESLEAIQLQADVVRELIKHGTNLQVSDDEGNTLLHLAAARGDTQMIDYLLSLPQLDLAAKNKQGEDALVLLLKSSLSAEQKYQLIPKLSNRLALPSQLRGQCLNQKDSLDNNFLHLAVTQGNLLLVQWLLTQPDEALLNAENQECKTPLALAVESGNLDIVKFLLGQPVALAKIKPVFLAALRQENTPTDLIEAFFAACHVNWLADVKALSDSPQRVVGKWIQGDQLQLKAFSYEYLTACRTLDQVKRLVAHGADPHAVDEQDNTLLHEAVLEGDLARINYLIEERGVKPHPQNKAGVTPLMALYASGKLNELSGASKTEDVERYMMYQKIADGLIQKKTTLGWASETLTQQDEQGNTLLHYAVEAGDTKAVNQLIKQKPLLGTNWLNTKNKNGETAVHLLVKSQILSEQAAFLILNALLSEGDVDPNMKDNLGRTPLDHIKYTGGYISVTALLIRKLPEPLLENQLQQMALMILQSEGMSSEQQKTAIIDIAKANNRDNKIAPAEEFYSRVLEARARGARVNFAADQAISGSDATFSLDSYIQGFKEKRKEKKDNGEGEFVEMITFQKERELACILDYFPETPFPEAMNKDAQHDYLNFAGNMQHRNLWVGVVQKRQRDKRYLTLQHYSTQDTLLHALVKTKDNVNLAKLSNADALYVTEKNREQKTVLQLVRESFPDEVTNQPEYSVQPLHFSFYRSILQAIERRLLVEKQDNQVSKEIIAELDFSQLTELEMLASLFARFKTLHIPSKDIQFLFQCPDKKGRFLGEAAMTLFDALAKSVKDEKLSKVDLAKKYSTLVRCQRMLVNVLAAAGIEQLARAELNAECISAATALGKQITYFSNQALCLYGFDLKKLETEGFHENDPRISIYNKLCNESGFLCKPTGDKEKEKSGAFTDTFFSFIPKSNTKTEVLSPEQYEKNRAYNMVIYLGFLIETLGADKLVTLPGASKETPCLSLLAAARKQKLPELYVEIVGRILTELNLQNPISIVETAQKKAAQINKVTLALNYDRLQGVSNPITGVAQQNPSQFGGLRINFGSSYQ